MKTISIYFTLVSLFIFSTHLFGQILSFSTIHDSETTNSDSFSDVSGVTISLDVTDIDNVLLVTDIQMEMSAPEESQRAATFRIVDAADPENINSGNIVRSLSNAKSTDFGIGSLVHIFDVSSYSGNRTYKLQHKFDNSNRQLTTSATLVGVLLKSGTNQLLTSSAQITSGVQMSDSWAGVTGLETAPITTTVYGGFYVAASIESLTTSFNTTSVAEWKLQYKKGVSGTWTDLSPVVERSMSNTSDIGIISLVGYMPDQSSPGDYYFRVAHRRTSASSVIDTNAGHLVAVSLGSGAVYYPVITKEVASAVTTSETFSNAASISFSPGIDTDVFLHAQYSLSASGEAESPKFDLFVDNSILDGNDMLRYISSSSSKGAGVNVGVAAGLLSATTYNLSLRHATASSATLTTSGVILGGFYLNAKTNTLPVELLSFKGKYYYDDIFLEWETCSEQSNDYFTLFKSTDAKRWVEVARLSGAGNSTVSNKYFYKDKVVDYNETAYYKLCQTDFDGKVREISIITVNASCFDDSKVIFYPNPVKSVIYIQGAFDSNAYVEIFNGSGQVIYKNSFDNGVINVHDFSNGVYFLSIDGGKHVRFVKTDSAF